MKPRSLIIVACASMVILAPLLALATTTNPPCLTLMSNLGRGMRGSSVASLQSYLTANTSYAAGITGYFGPITQAAIRQWQMQHGVPGTGYVGPLTRAALSCTGSGNNTSPITLNANPSSGSTPLTVTFSATPSNSGQYIIEFGDNTRSEALQSHCLSSNSGPDTPLTISCEISTTHTYQTPGTYTATLSPYVACLYTNPRCMMPTILLGQAIVTAY